MRTRIRRVCTFTLVSLLSLCGLAAQAGAQDSVHNQLNGSQKSRPQTGKGGEANIATAATGYTYSVLYSFCPNGGACTDGEEPFAGVIEDAAGSVYGTTFYGGNSNYNCFNNDGSGCGTVFQVGKTGQETVLYAFCSVGACTDGANPGRGLMRDVAGNLYGTTNLGGANGNWGTVFKVDSTGDYTVLYNFCSAGGNCADGYYPYTDLIQDAAGSLYGTTQRGGAHDDGTVFELTPPAQQGGTWTETVLYSFCSLANCADGYYSDAGLLRDAAGNLYGTTQLGGTHSAGTAFKLAPPAQQGDPWTETVLYSFCAV